MLLLLIKINRTARISDLYITVPSISCMGLFYECYFTGMETVCLEPIIGP